MNRYSCSWCGNLYIDNEIFSHAAFHHAGQMESMRRIINSGNGQLHFIAWLLDAVNTGRYSAPAQLATRFDRCYATLAGLQLAAAEFGRGHRVAV